MRRAPGFNPRDNAIGRRFRPHAVMGKPAGEPNESAVVVTKEPANGIPYQRADHWRRTAPTRNGRAPPGLKCTPITSRTMR